MAKVSIMQKISLILLDSLFNEKALSFDNIEQQGTFSTQLSILSLKKEIKNYISTFKDKNSKFYLFLENTDTDNFLLPIHNNDKSDEDTKKLAIVINESWNGFKVYQLSVTHEFLIGISEFEICNQK